MYVMYVYFKTHNNLMRKKIYILLPLFYENSRLDKIAYNHKPMTAIYSYTRVFYNP